MEKKVAVHLQVMIFHIFLAHRTCFRSLLMLRLDLAILGGSLALKHLKG